MDISWRHFSIIKLLSLAVLSMLLLGCNAGGDASSAASPGNQSLQDISLTGSVGDGPVTGATVEIRSAQGQLLKTLASDNTATFNARLRVSRSNYPLLLEVSGGIDLVTGDAPDFQLASVVTDRHSGQVNINPFSTLIVRVAQHLPGGLTTENVGTATNTVTGQLGFGLDPALLADPVLATVSDANIANLVKASEALGETIRRTRDLVSVAGQPLSADDVITALAADLQDGRLDGAGANGASIRVAATVKVVSGQVLVESLSNTLKVGGVVATLVMDQAVTTTRPGIGSEGLTQNVVISAGMLQQTLDALDAATVLDSSTEVTALSQTVSGISAGSLPADVAPVLTADSSRALDNAVLLATTVDSTQMAAINAVWSGGSTDSGTTALSAPVTTSPDTTQTTDYWGTRRTWHRHRHDTTTTDPTTTDPTTTDPTTTDPTTTDPTTTDPTTTDPTTTDPTTTDPTTTDPTTTDPTPTAPANQVPVISGAPDATVQAGTAYRFQPLASDADGDTLTFSISGRPAWASFNTRTGLLAGTPADGDAGTYRNVSISVTDGTDSAALPAFEIVVEPAPVTVDPTAGTLSLSWTAPVSRADGSPISLAEIGGYRIHYGTAAGTYTHTFNVSDGSLQTTTLSGLAAGTWYLVMTTVDTNGLESANSAEVVKVVN